MLDFDLARQPVRPHELAALVEAIENAHPSDEQDRLEWKSMLDLGSKAHLAAIAKCILALANRDPVTAASPLEKHPTGSSLRSMDSRSLTYTGRCTERSVTGHRSLQDEDQLVPGRRSIRACSYPIPSTGR